MGHCLLYGITELTDDEHTLPKPQPGTPVPVLHLPTPEGWKAELTLSG